jgi:omega-amidase
MNVIPKLKIGLCQISVGADKQLNIARASAALLNAAQSGSNLVVLPECWNCPYSTACFPQYAELIPQSRDLVDAAVSPSISMLCDQARSHGIWLVGGSVPERSTEASSGKDLIYNTCIVINPEGDIVAKHRKVHLFDIDVPGLSATPSLLLSSPHLVIGRITFKESDSLTGGSSATVVDTPWGGLGVGICYDIRFPELATVMRQRGATILVYPGAFNMVTGPAHWQLLQRARAVDNQVYVAACSPARDPSASYVAWGHSSVVSPWGEVLAEASEGEGIISAELDFNLVAEVRQNIPCWKQKRTDIYQLTDLVQDH